MATLIPRTSGPQVQAQLGPQVRNTAQVDLSPSIRAAGQVGQAAAQIFQQQKDRSDLTAVMQARRELSEWEGNTFSPANPDGVAKYRGQESLLAPDALLGDLDKRSGEIRSRLTPDQQGRFDQVAFSFRDSVQTRLNGYAERQYSMFEEAENKAAIDTVGQDAVRAGLAGDFNLADTRLQEVIGIAMASYQKQGYGPEALKAGERGIISSVRKQTVIGMALQDPFAAQDLYDRYADQLTPMDRAVVERELRPYVEDRQADADVDAWEGRNPVMAARADAASVQTQFASLGAQHGFRTTSVTRSEEENRSVGGVANSQHLETRGTARDWSVKGKTPEQISAFVADLKAEGFQVITEPHGTGPHIHAELPPQRKAMVPEGDPGSKADALAYFDSFADPRRRRAARQRYGDRLAVAEARRAEQDRYVSESINLAVENADPNSGASLRQLLGRNYTRAAERGWIPSLESRWKQRQTGQADTSSPTTVLAMDEAVYRASLGGEPARVALTNFNPYDPNLQLSASDRKRYADAQLKLLSGKPEQAASVASEAEINAIVKQYVTGTLKIPASEIGKSNAEGAKAWQFTTDMRRWAEQFENEKKRKPGYDEVMKQADLLTLQGTIEKPGWLWGTNKETFRVQDLNIPAADRIQIEEALHAAGKPVTADNINKLWLGKK